MEGGKDPAGDYYKALAGWIQTNGAAPTFNPATIFNRCMNSLAAPWKFQGQPIKPANLGKPRITITSPTNGQTVRGTFPVEVSARNFRLSCALYGKQNLKGYGHWHLNHDTMAGPMMGMGTMMGMSCANSFQASTVGLKPGKHTFFAILEDNQHAPMMPSVFGKVTVNVR